MKKILIIAGTRPEAIKMAPVYLQMQQRKGLQPVFCSTGQHAHLMDQALEPFGIRPDISLNAMREKQSLAELAGLLFQQIGNVLKEVKPDNVLVQGDTVSAFVGGWCAFYEKIPATHIEAGLRSHNLQHPFPEEASRRALSIIATGHMAATRHARKNLLREGVTPESIVVTGNTTIDALHIIRKRLSGNRAPAAGTHILVTAHRRENIGTPLQNLCDALRIIAEQYPHVTITYSVHPNPAVRVVAEAALMDVPNIRLIAPQNYQDFIALMLKSRFIISDSGGVQEEAPALGVPVLVTRETTERPEAIECGANLLVGTDTQRIVESAGQLLTDDAAYEGMRNAGSPYGDGRAAERICDWLEGKTTGEFCG